MPQFVPASLTGRDGVKHAYKPRDITGGVATLVESTGVPLGDRRISMSTSRTAGGKVKITVKFAMPVVEDVSVNGIVRKTVTRTNYAELSFNWDGASTANDRDDLMVQVWSFLNSGENPMVIGMIRDLEGLY